MEELVLMSSVLRLSMVSLMPLLTELLSSQLARQKYPQPPSREAWSRKGPACDLASPRGAPAQMRLGYKET